MDQVMGIVVGFISGHPYATLGIIAGLWLLSNVASALPSPSQSSSGFYKFFFAFMHGVTGAIPRILPFLRLPGDPSRNTQTFFGKPNPPAQ